MGGASLELLNPVDAQARSLGQRFLRQSGSQPVLSQQVAKIRRRYRQHPRTFSSAEGTTLIYEAPALQTFCTVVRFRRPRRER